MEFISQPWPWYVAGPLIALIMFILVYFGKEFGFSSNLRTLCTLGGAGKVASFFQFDWKAQKWNLMFVVGSILGGYIAAHHMINPEGIQLASSTVEGLQQLGFNEIGQHYLPDEIFGMTQLTSAKGILLLFGGGLLVGFGSRYAGGCTSGHAISGLSNLQLPSLIAVIGFFIGGLFSVHFLIPMLF